MTDLLDYLSLTTDEAGSLILEVFLLVSLAAVALGSIAIIVTSLLRGELPRR